MVRNAIESDFRVSKKAAGGRWPFCENISEKYKLRIVL